MRQYLRVSANSAGLVRKNCTKRFKCADTKGGCRTATAWDEGQGEVSSHLKMRFCLAAYASAREESAKRASPDISQNECIGPENLRNFFCYKELSDSRTGSDANILYL